MLELAVLDDERASPELDLTSARPPWRFLLAIGSIFAAMVWASRGDRPYSDALNWFDRAIATTGLADAVGQLWQPHNNQRILLSRLLALSDVYLTHSVGVSFLIASLAGLALGAWLFTVRILKATGRSGLWLTMAALSVWLDGGAAQDATLAGFGVYIFVAIGGVASALLMGEAFAKPEESPRLIGLALVGAVFAGFGNAAGLAIWPGLALICALRGRRKAFAAVLLAGGLYGLVTELGLGAPIGGGAVGSASEPHSLLKILNYFLQYCALPWSKSGWLGALRPLLGLGLAVAAGAGLARAPSRAPRLAALSATGKILVLFGLTTAVMAAIGRVNESLEVTVALRYAPFAACLQVGTLMCFAEDLERWAAGLSDRTFRNVSLGLIVLILAQHLGELPALQRSRARVAASQALFDQGEDSPDIRQFTHPDLELARRVYAELQQKGLWSPPPHKSGK